MAVYSKSIKISKKAQNQRAIKISEKAYTTIRKEMNLRLISENDRIKLKDIASDLIVSGFKNNQDKANTINQTIQYLMSLKDWKDESDSQFVEPIANIVYWEHIKLALSKGHNFSSAMEHVHLFLTDRKNKLNIISVIENYLNSLKFS